ncbi:MAG TPA: HAD-IC family P-type ATPase [Rhodanobacteraceae bacterium]|nr:HAD-IC family P-type ATPase [Rhodanobacteraceae bacterium]
MNTDGAVWSRPALAGQVLRRRRDGKVDLALRVPAIAVPRDALRLEQVLHALSGVTRISVEVAAQRLRVTFDDRTVTLPRVLAACAAAGCDARPLHRDSLDDSGRRLLDASLKRLLVAGVFAMQAMMFAFVLYIGAINPLEATTVQLFRWLAMLSAAPVVGYAAWPFYRDALAGLRAGRASIDVPVALAIALVFLASAVNAVRGGGEVYFDSISMFVFVLLLGRHLQLRAQLKHRAAGEVAADAMPLTARRLGVGGQLEIVAAAELVPGDRVRVAEGEAVPCDGALETAQARFDESLLSGEARARLRRRDDAIMAGAVALDGPLELRVERDVAASATTVLGRLAAAANATRDVAGNADAPAARRFVWRVLMLALAAAAFWLWRDPARAFDAVVAVLVVACPCAFGLAAPAVLTRTMAVLARAGVLVVRPAALDALARADRLLLDKTGTLTESATRSPGREALRPDAAATVAALRRVGMAPMIVSGDTSDRVAAIAAQLDIDDWAAQQSPSDKLARVRAEQAAGAVVLAVGDGSNDAAALAAADVSAAPAEGADLATTHADLALLRGLGGLSLARELATRARDILLQNRRWSLVWNLGAVPFAAIGFVPPWLAAIGMSVSSLAVVLNTLRVREPTPIASFPGATVAESA